MTVTSNVAASAYGRTASMEVTKLGEEEASAQSPFAGMVEALAEQAAHATRNAEAAAVQSLTGKAGLTDLVTAISEAELAVNTMVAIRDKVILAYQDILKMPI